MDGSLTLLKAQPTTPPPHPQTTASSLFGRLTVCILQFIYVST